MRRIPRRNRKKGARAKNNKALSYRRPAEESQEEKKPQKRGEENLEGEGGLKKKG